MINDCQLFTSFGVVRIDVESGLVILFGEIIMLVLVVEHGQIIVMHAHRRSQLDRQLEMLHGFVVTILHAIERCKHEMKPAIQSILLDRCQSNGDCLLNSIASL